MNRVVIEETVRRHVTNGAYLTFVALVAIVAFGASNFDRPGSMWPTLVAGLAIIAGAGVIGPEFSSGTLQLVLVKPVNRAAYLLSRVTGVVLAVWIAAGLGFVCESLGRVVWGGGRVPWNAVGGAVLSAMTDAVLTVALLALLGSLTRAYFNVAIYLASMISLSVGGGILAMARATKSAIGRLLTEWPVIERTVDLVSKNLFPDLITRLDPQWHVMVLSNAAVALLFACYAFRRREVPYGAD